MQAMLLEQSGEALRCVDLPVPSPGHGEVLIAIEACGVCRVAALGDAVRGLAAGQRVGVPGSAGRAANAASA